MTTMHEQYPCTPGPGDKECPLGRVGACDVGRFVVAIFDVTRRLSIIGTGSGVQNSEAGGS